MFIFTPFSCNRAAGTSRSPAWWDMAALWAGTKACHSPAQGFFSAPESKCDSLQLWKEWENKDESIQNHFAISVMSPFPLFFLYWVSLLSLIKQCLSAFTLMALHSSPHHLAPFYLSRQCLPQCWRAGDAWLPSLLCCIVIPHFCAFSYFTVALQKNSDTHEVSILSVIQAYTFSWAQLSPK